MKIAGRDFNSAWAVCSRTGRCMLLADTAAWYLWRKWVVTWRT